MAERPLAGTRVGIFGKGGAGKSTLTVIMAKRLHRRGYQVFVMDADSTNVGLYQVLGVPSSPAPLMQYFGGTVFRGGRVSCPVDDPSPLADSRLSLDALPKTFYSTTREGILYMMAGKIGGEGPGSGCDGPVSKIVRDVRLTRDGEPPVTIIDFKAGFEDVARGVIASLNQVLVVVDSTAAAIQMAVDMQETVRQIRSGVHPATSHLERAALVELAKRNFEAAEISGFFVVLNRVREPRIGAWITDRLRAHGIEPTATIPDNAVISEAWLEGVPFEIDDTTGIDETIRRMELVAAPPQAIR